MNQSKIVSLDEYREKLQKQETRVAWDDFPLVFILCPLGTAQNHSDYEEAKKNGNNGAALQLVKAIVPSEKIDELKAIIGELNPLILPVHAIEEFGTNKIPAALAYYLSVQLELELCSDIVQANKPQRTDKGAFYRLSQYPFFDGDVQQGCNYVILDDTLLKNIALGISEKDILNNKIEQVLEQTKIKNFVNDLPKGLHTEVGEDGAQISGGQKQRIGIARALYKQVDILVLDEATSSLDYDTESSVISSISKFAKDMTIIMITHRIPSLSNCNKIYKLDHGKVHEMRHFSNSFIFKGIQTKFQATRYHSLVADKNYFPKALKITAVSCNDQEIMGIYRALKRLKL